MAPRPPSGRRPRPPRTRRRPPTRRVTGVGVPGDDASAAAFASRSRVSSLFHDQLDEGARRVLGRTGSRPATPVDVVVEVLAGEPRYPGAASPAAPDRSRGPPYGCTVVPEGSTRGTADLRGGANLRACPALSVGQ